MPGSGNSSISAQDGPQETIIPVDKLRFNSTREPQTKTLGTSLSEIQSITLVTFYFLDYVLTLMTMF